MTTWLLLAGAIASEVSGTLSLKGALDNPVLYLPVAVGFVCAFVILAEILRRGMALGVTYGIWSASGVALTAVLSALVYHERFTVVTGLGLAVIMGGVLLVELGSRPAASQPAHRADASSGGR